MPLPMMQTVGGDAETNTTERRRKTGTTMVDDEEAMLKFWCRFRHLKVKTQETLSLSLSKPNCTMGLSRLLNNMGNRTELSFALVFGFCKRVVGTWLNLLRFDKLSL